MKTTDKQGCNILVALLAEHGVKRVVLSPGSRNAPLLMAFSRTPDIQDYVVCLLYTSPSPRDVEESRMPSSA